MRIELTEVKRKESVGMRIIDTLKTEVTALETQIRAFKIDEDTTLSKLERLREELKEEREAKGVVETKKEEEERVSDSLYETLDDIDYFLIWKVSDSLYETLDELNDEVKSLRKEEKA